MIGVPGLGLRLDQDVTKQQVKAGTLRRIIPYSKNYRWTLALLIVATAVDSAISVGIPLLLGAIIDDGILAHRLARVIELSAATVTLAVIDGLANYTAVMCSARAGQGLIFSLRNHIFRHVQQQPLAFFTRSQTGSLVSRLNSDVIGAQQAITTLLTQVVSTVLTLVLVLIAMCYLSWQITLIAVVIVPLFILPGKAIGKRLQRLTRQQMQLDAELGSMMNERFNVAGAMLSKLYGRPDEDSALFEKRSGRIRDVSIVTNVYARALFISLNVSVALITSMVYGVGGDLAISGTLKIGTIVSLVALIVRMYGPINQMSSLQISFLTSLVSFDRVFEIIDLKPLITDHRDAYALPSRGLANGSVPDIEFDRVCFRYPTAEEVSLPSLESTSLTRPERSENSWALREVSFRAAAGKLTALVGPSGAGKTTITNLAPRLYDPTSGTVRIGGHDLRDLTQRSVHDAVGVVTQDAHLFHDTIRANLLYARPGATEQELIEACEAARIWDLISSLPNGLDTVAGDRGYRFSGGEKQRVALARLLLKAPSVVVLDEATAHLDSESEAAIQRALKTALTGRTSLVIAHRLSTIREADQILVVDEGQIRERGTHEDLLLADGLYAELYRTQFAQQPRSGNDADIEAGHPARP